MSDHFSDSFVSLCKNTDKIILVEILTFMLNDSLNANFNSIIDESDFTQKVCRPTHFCLHTLDPVLICGIERKQTKGSSSKVKILNYLTYLEICGIYTSIE